MEKINIHTEFIRLDAALKFVAVVGSGGEAKIIIQSGEILVNDEICTMRGKKLHSGDTFEFNGKKYQIAEAK